MCVYLNIVLICNIRIVKKEEENANDLKNKLWKFMNNNIQKMANFAKYDDFSHNCIIEIYENYCI